MRKWFPWSIAALALGALLVAAACGDDDDDGGNGGPTPPGEVQLTEADNGSTVLVANGGTVIVALASNPSTGYSWAIVPPEPTNLELEGEPTYVPPGSTTPVAGAPGTEVFTLRATEAGTSELNMAYSRSFEPGSEPEETFSVTVEVR